MRAIAHAVPFSVWTSLVPPFHAGAEPARRVVEVVRARGELAVAAFRRQPRLDVVLLRGGRAEIAGRDVHDPVGQAEPAVDLLFDREDPIVFFPRPVGMRVAEHLDLVELVHAEDARACPCRRCRLRGGSSTTCPRTGAAARPRRGSRRDGARRAALRSCPRGTARRRRPRRPGRSVGKNPASSIACSRTSTGGETGANPSRTRMPHHPLQERELDEHRLTHHVGEPRAAHLGAALRVHESHGLPERGVVERGSFRGVADGAHDLAVVLAAVGDGRVGRVRELEGEGAQRGVGLGERGLERAQLLLQRAGGGDLRGPLVGCRPCRFPSTPRSGARAAPRRDAGGRVARRRRRARRRSGPERPVCVRCRSR